MKYVYVLTSSEKDLYYEQFFISVVSLRLYNPRAEIIALVDTATGKSLTGKRSGYAQYITEQKIIAVPGKFSQKESSRWIKTSIHHYVSGDFLFIDCDTVIAENLEQIIPANVKVGAVLDTHVTLDRHHLRGNFRAEDTGAGFVSSLKTNIRYNGGLIFCRDDPAAREFYEKWHTLWLEGRDRGCTQDMPSLNQANYEMNNIIIPLSGEWNCQISSNGLPFLANAKIIHYYATSLVFLEPAYILASSPILNSVRETGILSPEITQYLENPKTAFEPLSRIISDEKTIDAFEHSLFFKLIRFSHRHPGLFRPWNAITAFLARLIKRK